MSIQTHDKIRSQDKAASQTQEKIGTGFKEVHHYVFFTSPPKAVFELLMNEKKHAIFTGSAAKIDPRVGGAFSTFGGKVTGVTVELKPNTLIVQDWRGEDFPEGHTSRVRFELHPLNKGRGCGLDLHHTGIPEQKADGISGGWQSYYWTPMAEFLRNEKVAVVDKFLEEFKNGKNIDIVDETWTENCTLHVAGFDVPPGRKGQKEVGKKIFDAFDKIHVVATDTIVEGDRVVERHEATAVHKGEFMGIPATGKKVTWTENHIYRLEDGLIAEAWSEVSFHDLLHQISS